ASHIASLHDALPIWVLRRGWLAEGVTHRHLDVGTDGVTGDLYMPPDADGANPAGVLLIGGSEGGHGPKFAAALLASRGYPALAVDRKSTRLNSSHVK